MSLILVDHKHKQLITPSIAYSFNGNEHSLVESFLDLMRSKNGIGLAANQVGLPVSVFVMQTSTNEELAAFNPIIVKAYGKEISGLEGCLTYPDLFVKIKRFENVILQYQDVKGNKIEREFSNLDARVVQHEMGHLEGKIFYNKANRYHRDAALAKWKNSNG